MRVREEHPRLQRIASQPKICHRSLRLKAIERIARAAMTHPRKERESDQEMPHSTALPHVAWRTRAGARGGWDGRTLQMTQDTHDPRSLGYDSHDPECTLAIPQDFLRLPSLIPQECFPTEMV